MDHAARSLRVSLLGALGLPLGGCCPSELPTATETTTVSLDALPGDTGDTGDAGDTGDTGDTAQ